MCKAAAYTMAMRKTASSCPAVLEGEAAEKDLILRWHVLSVGVHKELVAIVSCEKVIGMATGDGTTMF